MEIDIRTDESILIMTLWGKHAIALLDQIKCDPTFRIATLKPGAKSSKIFVAEDNIVFTQNDLFQKVHIWKGFQICVM
jgi:hypothetical protein